MTTYTQWLGGNDFCQGKKKNEYRVPQTKREIFKTPPKIEEIQEKKFIDRN
jgi:hypothetical protein